MKSENCARKRRMKLFFFGGSNSFFPYSRNRLRDSLLESPLCALVPSRFSHSAFVKHCHSNRSPSYRRQAAGFFFLFFFSLYERVTQTIIPPSLHFSWEFTITTQQGYVIISLIISNHLTTDTVERRDSLEFHIRFSIQKISYERPFPPK